MEDSKDSDIIKEYVSTKFEELYLPSLMDFIRIPNLSPRFDPDWNTNGLQMQACEHLKSFADNLGIEGYTSEVVKEDDRTPVLFLTIEPFNTKDKEQTVL